MVNIDGVMVSRDRMEDSTEMEWCEECYAYGRNGVVLEHQPSCSKAERETIYDVSGMD